MRCPQAWYWGYVEGLTPLAEKKDLADWGTLFHEALAEYYIPGTVRGPHPADTWDKLAKHHVATIKTMALDEAEVATWEDFHELGLTLAEAYVDKYKGDPHWDILDSERRFTVTIPDVRIPPTIVDGKKGYTPICTLVGTFDLCYHDLNDGQVKMVDHKTAGRIFYDHLSLDPQASTYIAVATFALREQGLIGPKEVVKGMEYNFIKRAKLDERIRDPEGRARNKPQKKHYLQALADDADAGEYPLSDQEIRDYAKLKLDELSDECDRLKVGPVYGEISADQSNDNFYRHWVPRSPKERNRQIVRISQEASVMAKVAAGKLPILKNTTKECKWCKFFDLCELDEAGEDTEYFKSTVYKKNDPYFDHRPDAVNSKKLSEVEAATI